MVIVQFSPCIVPRLPSVEADVFQTSDGGWIAHVRQDGAWLDWIFRWHEPSKEWVSCRKATPEDHATIAKILGPIVR